MNGKTQENQDLVQNIQNEIKLTRATRKVMFMAANKKQGWI